MTTTGRGSHRAYDSDRDRLLDLIGRAGTPPVDETTFRVDPLALTGHDQTTGPLSGAADAETVLVVASDALVAEIKQHHRVMRGAPGMTEAQDRRTLVGRMVIEFDAFTGGAWSGTDSPHRHGVLLDLHATAVRIRKRGGAVYLVPPADGSADRTRLPGLRVDDELWLADTEGAPVSRLLAAVRRHAGLMPREDDDQTGELHG